MTMLFLAIILLPIVIAALVNYLGDTLVGIR